MAEPPAYLTLARIESKPKAVELSDHWRAAKALSAQAQADLLHLVRLIAAGTPLPDRFYRKDVDVTPDALLSRTGVMHLHLAGRGSDELIYLVQFTDFVLLLEANTHAHFATRPAGSLLLSLHQAPLGRAVRKALERRATRTQGFARLREAAARRRSGPPRGDED